jgi:hypothetical protein
MNKTLRQLKMENIKLPFVFSIAENQFICHAWTKKIAICERVSGPDSGLSAEFDYNTEITPLNPKKILYHGLCLHAGEDGFHKGFYKPQHLFESEEQAKRICGVGFIKLLKDNPIEIDFNGGTI